MENTLSILNNIFFWVIFATVALALITMQFANIMRGYYPIKVED